MSAETYLITGLLGAIGGFVIGIIFAEKYDNFSFFLISLSIGLAILLFSMFAQQIDLNMQREIYDKTVFQPWVQSLDSKSCEQLGDVILKQKLLDNQTATEAGLKAFNSKECHFDISSGQVLEMLK